MLKSVLLRYCLVLSVILGLISCSHYQSIPYFQNAKDFKGVSPASSYDMKIKPKDILDVFVFSPNSAEMASQFNIVDMSSVKNEEGRQLASSSYRIHSYLVENDGTINYPLVGKINLAGLTIAQAQECIKEKISRYFKSANDFLVTVYIINYQVTVMGEVKSPNTFTVNREKITVLEALAMAGDMTDYGKRENVKVLREQPDGTYHVHTLDMRDANILNSPNFYLQQRDILYVEPNEVAAQNGKIGETTKLWVRGADIIISLGSILYMVLQ